VSEYFTDDGSAYVELHGGLAPTFTERAQLAAGGSTGWEERWYPVMGIGEFVAADRVGALSVMQSDSGFDLAFYAVEPFSGRITVRSGGKGVLLRTIEAGPEKPYRAVVSLTDAGRAGPLNVLIEDANGATVLAYTRETGL